VTAPEIAPPGASAPLGATVSDGGVNFSVFSKDASRIELLLFGNAEATEPSHTIALDPQAHRTYHYWHAFVPGIGAGQIYGYRAIGPFAPARGLRFDGDKLLLDPYGRAVAVPRAYDRMAARRPGGNVATAMKSVVTDPNGYDWEDDHPLGHSFADTIIYELHVRGFTRHPSSGVSPDIRGTYAGLVEKIPYLTDLGITAVELLPIFQFDPQDAPAGLPNYWGYQPVSVFAPHHAYSSRHDALLAVDEFRDMVKALHRAGIEVILDVVFNHTSEGDADGPTICYRGFANDTYYILDDQYGYADFTGCGNTLNANQPIVRRMIQDSLRYWVTEMHVDGFRFDLASILSRDESGRPVLNPPVLWDIESDPLLAGTKLIAEAWDAGGLYQVGAFVGDAWQEWNGRFRDDVRHFLKGDDGFATHIASRLLGSPDIYGRKEREPEHSINFVTCHDGFTLNDLVSYNEKHNEANGQQSLDGADDNASWNCGVEGPCAPAAVEKLRNRQIKNFLALELMSAGTPMLLMGDELRHTQLGNNNAYCQDNETSWLDWDGLRHHDDIHRFVKMLIGYRRRRDCSPKGDRLSLNDVLSRARINWHGVQLDRPDWSEHSHSLALTFQRPNAHYALHVMLNAYWEPLVFQLPPAPNGRAWRRCIDTAAESPQDIRPLDEALPVEQSRYQVDARSVVFLVSRLEPATATAGASENT
jgi:glycogen operon protein